MKRIAAIYVLAVFVTHISCNSTVGPDDSIGPHGIYFSIEGNIYKFNYEGSNRIQLTIDKEDNNHPQITSDGQLLIYETQANKNRYPSGGLMYDYSVIDILNLSNQSVRRIAGESEWCYQPSLSPDKRSVVFGSQMFGHGNCVAISDINGKGYKRLTEYGSNRNPMFTPQGNQIIYVVDHDQKTNLFMMDLDGRNRRQLTDSEWNTNPVFSPDGSKIAWESYWDIFLMNLDGSDKINITNNNNIFARTPSFSHVGDKLVFITERSYNMPDDKRNREIHLVELNTKERKIVLATGDNHEPKFFPQDDRIIFSQYENFQFYICVINTDGSGLYRLGRGGNPCIY